MDLTGATVALTRSTDDNAALRARLEALGARVVELPTALLVDVAADADAVCAQVAESAAVAFTSRHGVAAFLRLLGTGPLVAAQARGGHVAAVGAATAQALAEAGVAGAIAVGEPATGAHLAERLADALAESEAHPKGSVLAVQARHARPELAAGLRRRGVTVAVAVLYENEAPPCPTAAALAACRAADAVHFAAPSAAERLLAWAPDLCHGRLVAIGPTTAAALRNLGAEPAAVASSPTLDANVAAIAAALGRAA